jgi:hypothetical protein
MLPVGFEPTISVGERPQTYALDLEAIWTGTFFNIGKEIKNRIRGGNCSRKNEE